MSVEDALPAPKDSLKSGFPKYSKRPGFAEIKPHNIDNIKAGLGQLRKEVATRDKAAAKAAADAGMPTPKSVLETEDVYLLTYDHRLSRTPGESQIVVYLLKPHEKYVKPVDKSVKKPVPDVTRGQRQAWVDGLGDWWSTGNVIAPEHSLGKWQGILGPVGFGNMMESIVRSEFFKNFGQPKQHTSKGHRTSEAGTDVHWLEVAEFLYELVSELGSELENRAA